VDLNMDFYMTHKIAIDNLKLKNLYNHRGEILSMEHFSASNNLPVTRSIFNKLKKILETAKTKFENSGSDTVSTFFRNWKKGSAKTRKILCNANKFTGLPHSTAKFAEITETVIDHETAKNLMYNGQNHIFHRDNGLSFISYTITLWE
jgi:hypothetical protein